MQSEGLSHKPIVNPNENHPPKSRGRPKGVKNRFKSVKIRV